MTATEAALLAAVRAIAREEAQEAARLAIASQGQPEAYLTTAQAAGRAGVKADTVLAWIADGKLPATRPQGVKSWRIRPADLVAFLAGESRGAEPLRLEDHRRAAAARLAASLKGGGQ